MSTKQIFLSTSVGWLVAVLGIAAARMALVDTPMSPAEYPAWLFLACVPATVALMIMRGLPTPSIAAVLYETERADATGAQRIARSPRDAR